MPDPATVAAYGVSNDPSAFVKFLKDWWHVLTAIAIFIFTLLVNIKYRIPEILRRLDKLEKTLKLDEEKMGLHVLSDDCKSRQDECQTRVCSKIEEVKVVNQETQREVKELRTFITKVDRQLASITSDVNNIKTHVNSQETKSIVENIVSQLRPLINASGKGEEKDGS